jgi:hypothetical protein
MAEVTMVEPEGLFGLYTRKQLARATNKSEATIRRWEALGLPVIRRGQLRLYDPQTTRAWFGGELDSPPARKPGRPRGRAT